MSIDGNVKFVCSKYNNIAVSWLTSKKRLIIQRKVKERWNFSPQLLDTTCK